MLNKQQQAAVDHVGSPLCIYAGPGTGKTLVLQKKYEALIQAEVDPRLIHGITFTTSAANELILRVSQTTGLDPGIINIGTFHSTALKIIQSNIYFLGGKPFKITSPELQQKWFYEIAESLKIIIEPEDIDEIRKSISIRKKEKNPFDSTDPTERKAEQIFPQYEKRLKDENRIDFDDMLIKVNEFIANSQIQKGKYQQIYQYILVDEAQDMDSLQYNFIKQLTTQNTTIVGDDDQAIFGFAGADHTLMKQFTEEFNATTITLPTNYRSTKTIINASQHLIKNNTNRTEKHLTSIHPEGPKIKIIESHTDEEECNRIIESINPDEITGILYRINEQANTIESTFQRKGILYKTINNIRFHEHKEIKLALAILTLTHFNNEEAFRIVAESRTGIGKQTINRYIKVAKFFNKTYLDACAIPLKGIRQAQGSQLTALKTSFQSQQDLPLLERAENLINRYVQPRKETEAVRLSNFMTNLRSWQGSIQEFTTHIKNQETSTNTAIQLSTLHESKGMEFDHVILNPIRFKGVHVD